MAELVTVMSESLVKSGFLVIIAVLLLSVAVLPAKPSVGVKLNTLPPVDAVVIVMLSDDLPMDTLSDSSIS